MQPLPPWRMLASRNSSLPANTSKPPFAKCSSIALVFDQSPEESFTPATMPGVLAEQPLDQAERDRHLRHRRDVIQVELQPLVADALDHLGEIAVQAFVGHVLVVEGRQHQHAGAAHLERRAGELHRVRQRAIALYQASAPQAKCRPR